MIKDLFAQYKEAILYIIFGGCTTLVNIIVYYMCAHMLLMGTVISTVLAWILSVGFAYITNRIYVFQSLNRGLKEIIKEIISFVGCRLLTGLMDLIIMFICVEVMQLNDMIIKIFSNILVIVLNYVASKMFIFKK